MIRFSKWKWNLFCFYLHIYVWTWSSINFPSTEILWRLENVSQSINHLNKNIKINKYSFSDLFFIYSFPLASHNHGSSEYILYTPFCVSCNVTAKQMKMNMFLLFPGRQSLSRRSVLFDHTFSYRLSIQTTKSCIHNTYLPPQHKQ